MKKFKHTPGEWLSFKHKNGNTVIYDDSYFNRHIAHVIDGGVPEEEAEANAKLIKASNKLLEALQLLVAINQQADDAIQILNDSEGRCDIMPTSEEWQAAFEKAKSAIEKATT